MTKMFPYPTIKAFDQWLFERGESLEATIIGGAALVLLGVIDRQTRDVDVLHPVLSEVVFESAREFARCQRAHGMDLADDWLNNGPIQVAELLPQGWHQRTRAVFEGRALRFVVLGREDLLKTKLFALCDRGTDLADCIALAPKEDELVDAEPWLALQDAHPLWANHVRATLTDLRRRLSHGI